MWRHFCKCISGGFLNQVDYLIRLDVTFIHLLKENLNEMPEMFFAYGVNQFVCLFHKQYHNFLGEGGLRALLNMKEK